MPGRQARETQVASLALINYYNGWPMSHDSRWLNIVLVFSITGVCSITGLAPALAGEGAGSIPKIAMLAPFAVDSKVMASNAQFAAFRDGLRELGYQEGRNIAIEYRFTQRVDELPTLAAELVSARVKLIVALTAPAVRAAQRATATIPIVMVAHDPVAMGFSLSLAHPTGNITGIAFQNTEITVKRFDLLTKLVPDLRRIAVIWNEEGKPADALKALKAAAQARNIEVLALELRDPAGFGAVIAQAKSWGAQGVVQLASPVLFDNRGLIIAALDENRLPATCELPEWAADGCLMSYSADTPAVFRRLAYFIDRILKGALPESLPIEQPREFVFVINQKTANAFGLTVPTELLVQAHEVIR